jgi:hypothetical protein
MRYLKYIQVFVLTILVAGIMPLSPAHAITVTVEPVTQNVTLGNQAIVGVMIYGYAPGNPVNLAIGSYNFNINYDPAILGFNSLVFGTSLGGPTDSITTSNIIVNGVLNISEASSLSASELYALQGQQWPDDTFIAATLTFDTLGTGLSPVSVDINFLLTEGSGSFDNYYSDPGSVNVNNSVPEPSTLLLLGAGIGGLVIIRRKARKQ